jgi:hypothetical protein
MAQIEESRINHGKIDLSHLFKPIIECLQKDENSLLKEHEGKIYVMTDKIIGCILENQACVNSMRKEGHLFSDLKWATAIATLHKDKVAQKQMKQAVHLEEVIYETLQSLLSEKEADFFGQSASSYFDALSALAGKKNEIGRQQSAAFPDAQLLKDYPGTRAILRVPRHTIQMKGELSEAFVKAVKQVVEKRLSRDEYPEDEIDSIIQTIEKGLDDNTSPLSPALKVFDENAYGRIRRTYACSVLEKMVPALDNNSPAISYIRRVSDFNELVQGTLGLSAKDLVLEFPNSDGKCTMNFDLMNEFSRADALRKLPFWFRFDELLFENTKTENITTTLGQHFKMNGKVMTEGCNSVFEFHVNELTTMANLLKEARAKGQGFPNEYDIHKALRIAVLYYVVFYHIPNPQSEPKDALANYNEFREKLANLVANKVGLEVILARIAKGLSDHTIIRNNTAIRQAFKKLLQSRQPEKFLPKQKLYLSISNEILNNTAGIVGGKPIVSQDYDTSYLKFLKVTRFSDADPSALLKEEISFTESLRYLTLPANNQPRKREMNRDIDRKVLGVLFMPKDNEMRYFALPFKTFTNLIISYDRNQINGTEFGKDDYLTGLARLIYVLLIYGVFKAVERLEGEYQQSLLETTDDNSIKHANRTMMLMLSLFPDEEKHFTHDAHKAIEHVIKQHMPTKSQGFRLLYSKDWDEFVKQSSSEQIKEQANNHIQQEMKKDYRAANIIGGLSSGLDSLWHLPDEPSLKKVAMIVVTSRACDKTRQDSEIADRKVMYGNIHRFEYETQDENGLKHFYRHQPVEAFCDDMNVADSFKNPSVLFRTIRQLYKEGCRNVIVVTKVPFTRRIRMTTDENTTYINPKILHELYKKMPELRIYPLFTQKSYGVRLLPKQPRQPMFIPYNPSYDESIPDKPDNSTLFRAASVLTNHVIGKKWEVGDKLHSGITDYLFRWYPETATIQSQAMAALTNHGQEQTGLHEILRFLHANAFEQVLGSKNNSLEAKLDALETIIGNGDENIGHQADSLQFPKPKKGKGPNNKTHYFSINMIALLKHIENQSNEYRKKFVHQK